MELHLALEQQELLVLLGQPEQQVQLQEPLVQSELVLVELLQVQHFQQSFRC